MFEHQAVQALNKEPKKVKKVKAPEPNLWAGVAAKITVTVIGGVAAAYTIKYLKKSKLL